MDAEDFLDSEGPRGEIEVLTRGVYSLEETGAC